MRRKNGHGWPPILLTLSSTLLLTVEGWSTRPDQGRARKCPGREGKTKKCGLAGRVMAVCATLRAAGLLQGAKRLEVTPPCGVRRPPGLRPRHRLRPMPHPTRPTPGTGPKRGKQDPPLATICRRLGLRRHPSALLQGVKTRTNRARPDTRPPAQPGACARPAHNHHLMPRHQQPVLMMRASLGICYRICHHRGPLRADTRPNAPCGRPTPRRTRKNAAKRALSVRGYPAVPERFAKAVSPSKQNLSGAGAQLVATAVERLPACGGLAGRSRGGSPWPAPAGQLRSPANAWRCA